MHAARTLPYWGSHWQRPPGQRPTRQRPPRQRPPRLRSSGQTPPRQSPPRQRPPDRDPQTETPDREPQRETSWTVTSPGQRPPDRDTQDWDLPGQRPPSPGQRPPRQRPPCEQNHRQMSKHYLAATSLRSVIILVMSVYLYFCVSACVYVQATTRNFILISRYIFTISRSHLSTKFIESRSNKFDKISYFTPFYLYMFVFYWSLLKRSMSRLNDKKQCSILNVFVIYALHGRHAFDWKPFLFQLNVFLFQM